MTIKLHIFQKIYKYENNCHLKINEERLAYFLII